MRVVLLAAGAADMYCGACMRDVSLARALIARGHPVNIVPLYTPLRIEGDMPSPVSEVHLGAVNVYLQQLSDFFARMPRPLRRVLDSPGLLRWLSRFAVSTRAEQLGPLTVSVLAGPEGRQKTELGRLIDFVSEPSPPDVVTITNSLLSGIAPALKERLRVPVVCELKGEDGFVDALPEPHRTTALDLMRRNAESIDHFIAPTHGYAEQMAAYLNLPRERIAVIYSPLDADAFAPTKSRVRDPFTIGYLAVIIPRKGLHVLVEAVRELIAEGREIVLRVAGQALDRRYLKQIQRKIKDAEIGKYIEFVGELSFAEKIEFLHSLSVLCQPSIKPETLGMVALEAQAAGLPVVVPDAGVFPEMLAVTGGGVLFAPADALDLARKLAGLMDDGAAADRMGKQGAAAVKRHFSPDAAAETLIALLAELVVKRS